MPVLLKDYKRAGISAIKVLLNLNLLALECYAFNDSTCDFFFFLKGWKKIMPISRNPAEFPTLIFIARFKKTNCYIYWNHVKMITILI